MDKQKKIKVRGSGCYDLSDNSFSFKAFNEAPPSKQNVQTCSGGGKSWVTVGSDPSRMISLKCKQSSPDQYSELVTQFNKLTKDLRPKKPVKMPDRLRVVNEDGLQCWLNESKAELTFSGTVNIGKHTLDWQAEVLRQVQLVVRRLPASEKFNTIVKKFKNQKEENRHV